jgi:hypothetical protein
MITDTSYYDKGQREHAIDSAMSKTKTRRVDAARWSGDEDSDDADEDIYDLDAQNYLSWEKCKHEIDLNHPRKLQKNEDGSTTYSNWPWCGTKTGSLGCKAKNRESDLV